MLRKIAETIKNTVPANEVAAHCDGPCGVYDPSSARIAAEAAVSMTKKILAMEVPAAGDAGAWAAYNNTMSRYVAIKEEQAHLAKSELLVLWTDYFKPPHLEKFPNLHETFWKAAKLCSSVKVEVSAVHAQELMDAIKEIHEMFWASKGREVTWYTAS
ncbi:MAG: superoxide dismutase, Ni [Deltaproteobacteria bacterium]|jgi:nickel superoxide dismutase|nr:superoxide dismutase, Ni [Deltaproteobacteria bacterium]MBT6431560.1 superoxide dismutase, Ni [Deltaproteobacteria bacterium]MBT6488128.1 superoxide dismutase, Ni [Deltaproteobacteria bacterium]